MDILGGREFKVEPSCKQDWHYGRLDSYYFREIDKNSDADQALCSGVWRDVRSWVHQCVTADGNQLD